jgi:hypothetical protein
MTIMCVLVEKLVWQVVMRWIPVLECLLSGARRRLWLRPIMLGIKCHCFQGPDSSGLTWYCKAPECDC